MNIKNCLVIILIILPVIRVSADEGSYSNQIEQIEQEIATPDKIILENGEELILNNVNESKKDNTENEYRVYEPILNSSDYTF